MDFFWVFPVLKNTLFKNFFTLLVYLGESFKGDLRRVGFLLGAYTSYQAQKLQPTTLGLPNPHSIFFWIPRALTNPSIRHGAPTFTLDCHQHLLGSVWILFMLFKTGEYPEDPLPNGVQKVNLT